MPGGSAQGGIGDESALKRRRRTLQGGWTATYLSESLDDAGLLHCIAIASKEDTDGATQPQVCTDLWENKLADSAKPARARAILLERKGKGKGEEEEGEELVFEWRPLRPEMDGDTLWISDSFHTFEGLRTTPDGEKEADGERAGEEEEVKALLEKATHAFCGRWQLKEGGATKRLGVLWAADDGAA
jgi:hypothetical protein